MATKKDKTEKATLKKAITPSSAAADEAAKLLAAEKTAGRPADESTDAVTDESTEAVAGEGIWIDGDCKDIYIKSDIPDGSNIIPEGKSVNLEALATENFEYSIDDVVLRWRTVDGHGYFKDKDGLDLVKEVVDAATVEFRAVEIDPPQEIEITLEAKLKDSYQNFKVVCRIELFMPQPEMANLRDIDEELHNLNETIKTTPNFNKTVPVSLQRTSITRTPDVGLWVVIRKSTQAIGFDNYSRFMNFVLRDVEPKSLISEEVVDERDTAYLNLLRFRALPFNDTDAYRLLKVATEAFLLINGGVKLDPSFPFEEPDVNDLDGRIGGAGTLTGLKDSWSSYLNSVNSAANPILPYLAMVSNKFGNETLRNQVFFNQSTINADFAENQTNYLAALRNKVIQPFLVELIWSYWHEEGMLVQTMNAIARRFQNVRGPNGSRDPLANLEIDPLRGLNNLLWGYVQDEQHRLSLIRRVYEYKHQYGIGLQGKAVPKLYPAESRSKFIEAFHHLLHLTSLFYKQDDDTTVNSDGFPILNALREVHLILSQGAHNQFGDLPSTARQEMLIQQWLLARPEFREFLPTRNMVAYPEPWMDRVDAMKTLQGWTDISIDHFNRLAVFGEQILLSIRFGAWSHITQSSPSAANWARFWRAEIQGYIHDYRAVTGVDLSSSSKVDSIPPSVHLFNRYMAQARR